MSQSVITRHDIEHFTFREYRKHGTTKLSNETLEEGQRVLTLEGEYTCGELSRLAIDAKGNVYPVAESVFAVSYEPAGADPSAEIARLRRLVHDIYSPLYDARTMIELALIGELHMTPDRIKQLQEISAQCESLLDRLIGEKHGT